MTGPNRIAVSPNGAASNSPGQASAPPWALANNPAEYFWLTAATVVTFDKRGRWSSTHYAPD